MIDPGSIALFLGMLLSRGREVVDFSNDILNNVVSLTGDAHQARVAQDIFRQEIRYERSLQMREDIRDMNKVMLESVTSYLFLGSIVLGTCFVTIIEGFPPLNTSRMVLASWLLFAVWSITFTLLGIWFALNFQVRISAAARERLLRRYRYRLVDDSVVGKLGGNNLVNTFFGFGTLMAGQVQQKIADAGGPAKDEDKDEMIPKSRVSHKALRVKVQTLDQTADGQLDLAPLQKQMNAWMHHTGRGYARPTILDAPYFLLEETVIRQTWEFEGRTPLLLRVYGEATLYIAAQCPPLGTFQGEEGGTTTLQGIRKAIGADVPEWPEDELPVVTAGFHPVWKGPSGYGEFQRVEGFSFFVSQNSLEVPIYKIVLGKVGKAQDYVDVIVCWKFKTFCEALTVVVRKGHVHCKEEDWPIAEFTEEVRQLTPLQDFSGYYLRRGIAHLSTNVVLAVLSRLWLLGARPAWWLEIALMSFILSPAVAVLYFMPINSRSTRVAQNLQTINQADSAQPFNSNQMRGSLEVSEGELEGSFTSMHMSATSVDKQRSEDPGVLEAGLWQESPPLVPRQSMLGSLQSSLSAPDSRLDPSLSGGDHRHSQQEGTKGTFGVHFAPENRKSSQESPAAASKGAAVGGVGELSVDSDQPVHRSSKSSIGSISLEGRMPARRSSRDAGGCGAMGFPSCCSLEKASNRETLEVDDTPSSLLTTITRPISSFCGDMPEHATQAVQRLSSMESVGTTGSAVEGKMTIVHLDDLEDTPAPMVQPSTPKRSLVSRWYRTARGVVPDPADPDLDDDTYWAHTLTLLTRMLDLFFVISLGVVLVAPFVVDLFERPMLPLQNSFEFGDRRLGIAMPELQGLPQLPLGPYNTLAAQSAAIPQSGAARSVNSSWHCPGWELVLLAVESHLDEAADSALADELYAAAAREGPRIVAGSVCSPLAEAVGWLHHLHFEPSGAPRHAGGAAKFRRRLRLLLGELVEAASGPRPGRRCTSDAAGAGCSRGNSLANALVEEVVR